MRAAVGAERGAKGGVGAEDAGSGGGGRPGVGTRGGGALSMSGPEEWLDPPHRGKGRVLRGKEKMATGGLVGGVLKCKQSVRSFVEFHPGRLGVFEMHGYLEACVGVQLRGT
nr:hypothetical protein CFP56_73905 [Quercus suber]